MLGRVPQATLEKAAADPRYLALYAAPAQRYDAHMRKRQRPSRRQADRLFLRGVRPDRVPADLLRRPRHSFRRPSEVGQRPAICPLVGVGLLYQQGYFRQYLNPDGWQQERYPDQRFLLAAHRARDMTPDGSDLMVNVRLPTGNVFIQVWQHRSRPREALSARHQHPAERAAAGSRHHRLSSMAAIIDTRIRQEIVLGIGGLRALQGAGPQAHRLPHERRPLGVPGAGAHPRADGGTEADASTKRWKPRAPTTFSPRTRPCPPASICSMPA